ncbi:MAG: hypothetical protein IJO83_07300 [Clostridia bacterium]|nr:hypothetical protein [Clostridia bacterium]
MASFGERLNSLMQSAGLKEENMVYLLGISSQRLENLLTGYSEADVTLVERVASIFDVAPSYAAGLSDKKEVAEANAREIFVAERLDPVSGMMRLKDVTESIYIDKSELHGKDYIGLKVKDDSMAKARIFEGDTVVVRRQQFADSGNVVAVLMEDGSYIIRRYSRKGNIVTLTCEGDGIKYPPIKVDTKEETLRIIGRVTELRVSF